MRTSGLSGRPGATAARCPGHAAPWAARGVAAAFATALFIGAASGCSGSARPGHADAGVPSALTVIGDSPAPGGPGATPSASAQPSPSTAAATPTVPHRANQPTTTLPTTRRTTAAPPAAGGPPRIVSFTVRQKPTCLGPGRPGRDLVLAWAVAGAQGAELSEDTPGLPGSYNPGLPAVGTVTVPFGCDGDGGATELHVFDLYAAVGDMNQAPYSELDVSLVVPPGAVAGPAAGAG